MKVAKQRKRRRTDKRGLIRIIEVAYPRYGARAIARMTGYRHEVVYRYAKDMGLRCVSNRVELPEEHPPELLSLLLELKLAA